MKFRLGIKKDEFVKAIKLVKKTTTRRFLILRNICLQNDKDGNMFLVGTDLSNTIVVKLRKVHNIFEDDSIFRFIFNPDDMLRIIKDADDDISIESCDKSESVSISSGNKIRYIERYASSDQYPVIPPYLEPKTYILMKAGVFKDISSKLVSGREKDVIYISPEHAGTFIYYGTESTRTVLIRQDIKCIIEEMVGIPGVTMRRMSQALNCNDENVIISYLYDGTIAIKCNNFYMLCVKPTSKLKHFAKPVDNIVTMIIDKDSILDSIHHLTPLTKYGNKNIDNIKITLNERGVNGKGTIEMVMYLNNGLTAGNHHAVHADSIEVIEGVISEEISGDYDIHELHRIIKAVSGDMVLFTVIKNEEVGNIIMISSAIKGVRQQYMLVQFNKRIQYAIYVW